MKTLSARRPFGCPTSAHGLKQSSLLLQCTRSVNLILFLPALDTKLHLQAAFQGGLFLACAHGRPRTGTG